MPQAAPSSSFRDPIGLVLRMLRSGNKAAYSALLHEAMRFAAIPLDLLLAGLERRSVARASGTRHPLLLIVGPPRGGTTLVYQALAQYLDVTVPTNLSALFPRAPLTASRLFRRKRRTCGPDFRTFYGQTASLRGSNDAFPLWDRWLGTDHYQPATEFSATVVREMQQFFAAWTTAFDKPFLNKNNRNAACVDTLARHLPSAYFIVVQRQPLFVVQSLIKARRQVQGNAKTGWGLHSHSTTDDSDPLAYVDDVCRQVQAINNEIDRQLEDISASRVVRITYEEFCQNPAPVIARVAHSIPGVVLNAAMPLDTLPPFRASTALTLSPLEQARVRQCLEAEVSSQAGTGAASVMTR